MQSPVEKWLGHISSYEKEFAKWERRSEKILKRYRDDERSESSTAKFNILWSNVQTLRAATFAKLPKPDVSRRFKDQDPVGRVASLILERGLEYEIEKYADYQHALRACIDDRFLGGRGTAWVRYEPHFKAAQQGTPVDGDQITEDVDQPNEELDYECAPCDYVHWKDFGHTLGRTWEEVSGVWRKVYLTRKQCLERFPDEGDTIPLDSSPDDKEKLKQDNEERSRALIYEVWDKDSKTALWISKSLNKVLDEKEDPLKLDEFFPCPRPLYATLTNDSLVPVPDFYLYQDQANEIDTLCERIDGLIKALKVSGVYDASTPELARLFSEAENGTLIPVKDWMKFAEKNGLKGAIDVVDLTFIFNALAAAYQALESVKNYVYEITGISDIVRGQTDPNETLGAQELKGQYASLRLKSYQDEVGRFATELLRIKAQIICSHYSPQTIVAISAAEQLSQVDQQLLTPALALLIGEQRLQDPTAEAQNPLRSFRVEIAADSLVFLDEEKEKQSRMEFLNATSGFIQQAVMAGTQLPQITPLLMELLKFGVAGFKIGKSIEGVFDESLEKLKALSQQPPAPPPPDPKLEEVKQNGVIEQQKLQQSGQFESQRLQLDQQKSQGDLVLKQDQIAKDHEFRMAQLNLDAQKHNNEMAIKQNEHSLKRDLQNQQLAHDAAPLDKFNEQSDMNRKEIESIIGLVQQSTTLIQEVSQTMSKAAEIMANAADKMTAPKRRTAKKGPDGSWVFDESVH